MVQVARFDGTGDRATAADSTRLRTADTAITFAGWVQRLAAGAQWHNIAGKPHTGAPPYSTYAVFRYSSTGRLQAALAIDGVEQTTAFTDELSLNEWYFFALTWSSGGQVRLRLWDSTGSLAADVNAGSQSGAISHVATEFAIGGNSAGEDGNQRVACVGIHNAVLSDAQLRTDASSWFNTGRPPVTLSGPFWPLEGAWTPDGAYGVTGDTLTAVGDATFDDVTVPWTPPGAGAAVNAGADVNATTAQSTTTKTDVTTSGFGGTPTLTADQSNGDPLPTGVSFADDADGTGTFTLNHAAAGVGTWTLRVRGVQGGDDVTDTFTYTVTAPPTTQTLWADAVTPPIETGDASTYSLGTQFTPAVDGDITHLRYYEPAGTSESITLYLRDAAGGVLASVEHAQTGAAAWVNVPLASPVAVTSGTTYKTCYDHPSTNSAYAANPTFHSSAYNNGADLDAPVSAGQFVTALDSNPTSTFNDTAYYADVVFDPAGGATPTADAGAEQRTLASGADVTVDASASTPPGGETITGYAWTQTAGPAVTINSPAAASTTVTPGATAGQVTLQVEVTASGGGTDTATVIVGVGDNWIEAENYLTGTPRATWDLAAAAQMGDLDLQGFADGLSVDVGDTVDFKIADFDGAGWTAEVYRLGWYGGDGARLIDTLTPSAGQLTDSQAQPAAANVDPNSAASADCAAWDTTLQWDTTGQVSGVYVLRLVQTGSGDDSHIWFVVRDDARAADLALKTSDATWVAYNYWNNDAAGWLAGGNSLYAGQSIDQYSAGRASHVSYNRPFINRGHDDLGGSGSLRYSNLFGAEYNAIQFLERNGYDVKYLCDIDCSADGSILANVAAAISVGHDEYWTIDERACWEAARDTHAVNLIFWSGNEVFWRCREADADVNGRSRTLICYKDTIPAGVDDPVTWTGTWRDSAGAASGGDNPENLLTGTIFVVNGVNLAALQVPFAYADVPLWRDCADVQALTTGQTWSSPAEILGFEWDTYAAAGVSTGAAAHIDPLPYPVRHCSSRADSFGGGEVLQDAGQAYGAGDVEHRLSMYRAPSGALVFGAGTVQWSWGLNDANTATIGSDNTDTNIQQATVNLLADMGAQPTTLQAGLVTATPAQWIALATAAITADDATVASTAAQTIDGSSALTADDATVTAAAAQQLDGQAALVADDATVAAAAAQTVDAQAALTADDATVSAAAAQTVSAAAALTADDAAITATGAQDVGGSAALTADDATLSAAGGQGTLATVAITTDDATVTAAGEQTIDATAAITSDDATVTAAGEQTVTGQAAVTADDAVVVASSGQVTLGTAALTADDATVASTATQTITATAAITADDATAAGSGTAVGDVAGTASITTDDAGLVASGLVANPVTGTAAITADDATVDITATLIGNATRSPFVIFARRRGGWPQVIDTRRRDG